MAVNLKSNLYVGPANIFPNFLHCEWLYQCCRKSKILGGPTDHPWFMVGWSVSVLGGLSVNNLMRSWSQLTNWSKWVNRNPCFYSGTSTNRHIDDLVQDCSISCALAMEILQYSVKPWISYDISSSAELSVHLYLEIFSAKHTEFIGCQTDHPW